jgi:hypothetical protein
VKADLAHPAVQDLGAWLAVSRLLVPSRRRWPEANLVIYPSNLEGPEFIEPVGAPEDWTTA